jgi:hypothetical protein
MNKIWKLLIIIKLCIVYSYTVKLFAKETDHLLYKGDSWIDSEKVSDFFQIKFVFLGSFATARDEST